MSDRIGGFCAMDGEAYLIKAPYLPEGVVVVAGVKGWTRLINNVPRNVLNELIATASWEPGTLHAKVTNETSAGRRVLAYVGSMQ